MVLEVWINTLSVNYREYYDEKGWFFVEPAKFDLTRWFLSLFQMDWKRGFDVSKTKKQG